MARPHYGNFNNGNMQSMMRQVQKMQQQLTEAQNKLEEQEFTGEGGGGMVSISMTGAKAVTNVVIKPECVDPDDVEMLQDMVKAAITDCLSKIEAACNESMGKIAPNLGGMGGLF